MVMRGRHPLDALLKQRRWEREDLSLEAARARRIWEDRSAEHQAVLEVIARTESQLRELYEARVGFAPERRSILEVFLKHQHEIAGERRQAVAWAHKLYGQVMAQLEVSRVAVKVLEKHAERTKRTQDDRERRSELRTADDMWLLRRGSR